MILSVALGLCYPSAVEHCFTDVAIHLSSFSFLPCHLFQTSQFEFLLRREIQPKCIFRLSFIQIHFLCFKNGCKAHPKSFLILPESGEPSSLDSTTWLSPSKSIFSRSSTSFLALKMTPVVASKDSPHTIQTTSLSSFAKALVPSRASESRTAQKSLAT